MAGCTSNIRDPLQIDEEGLGVQDEAIKDMEHKRNIEELELQQSELLEGLLEEELRQGHHHQAGWRTGPHITVTARGRKWRNLDKGFGQRSKASRRGLGRIPKEVRGHEDRRGHLCRLGFLR